MIVTLVQSDLPRIVSSFDRDHLVVVDCYADWCGPCKSYGPQFESISNRWFASASRVSFLKCKDEDSLAYYNVGALPTTLFLRSGREIGRVMGADAGTFSSPLCGAC